MMTWSSERPVSCVTAAAAAAKRRCSAETTHWQPPSHCTQPASGRCAAGRLAAARETGYNWLSPRTRTAATHALQLIERSIYCTVLIDTSGDDSELCFILADDHLSYLDSPAVSALYITGYVRSVLQGSVSGGSRMSHPLPLPSISLSSPFPSLFSPSLSDFLSRSLLPILRMVWVSMDVLHQRVRAEPGRQTPFCVLRALNSGLSSNFDDFSKR